MDDSVEAPWVHEGEITRWSSVRVITPEITKLWLNFRNIFEFRPFCAICDQFFRLSRVITPLLRPYFVKSVRVITLVNSPSVVHVVNTAATQLQFCVAAKHLLPPPVHTELRIIRWCLDHWTGTGSDLRSYGVPCSGAHAECILTLDSVASVNEAQTRLWISDNVPTYELFRACMQALFC